MSMDHHLSIGRLARLAGLSIGALRHYDELDLLRPGRVDSESGYRQYRLDQLERARTIARLRSIDLSLEEIAAVLALGARAAGASARRDVRHRLEARTGQPERGGHELTQLVDGKE